MGKWDFTIMNSTNENIGLMDVTALCLVIDQCLKWAVVSQWMLLMLSVDRTKNVKSVHESDMAINVSESFMLMTTQPTMETAFATTTLTLAIAHCVNVTDDLLSVSL